MALAKDIAESRHNILVFINALTRASDWARSSAHRTLAHRLHEPGQRGKNTSHEKRNQARSTPQEQQGLQVPRAFLERTIQKLHDYVQDCVVELVFNLDEVRISNLEDRKTKNVIVPAAMLDQTIRHRVSRNMKHISVIACLFPAGESLLPDMVFVSAGI
jgi:hypothetical protein